MVRAVPVVIVSVVLALGLGGCSEDETPGPASTTGRATADTTAGAEVREGLAALFAGDHPDARQDDAGRCFAGELTARVGLDRLEAAGVVGPDGEVVADLPPLPAELAGDWADAQLACTDFVADSTRAQVQVSKGGIDRDAYAECLGSTLTPTQVRAAVVASLQGEWDSADLERLAQAQAGCARSARSG